jgi:hypothetical protein
MKGALQRSEVCLAGERSAALLQQRTERETERASSVRTRRLFIAVALVCFACDHTTALTFQCADMSHTP